MFADALREFGERRRRHGQIVHSLGGAAKLFLFLLEDFEEAARVGCLEAATREAEARSEVLPWSLGRLRAELLQADADALLEVLV